MVPDGHRMASDGHRTPSDGENGHTGEKFAMGPGVAVPWLNSFKRGGLGGFALQPKWSKNRLFVRKKVKYFFEKLSTIVTFYD